VSKDVGLDAADALASAIEAKVKDRDTGAACKMEDSVAELKHQVEKWNANVILRMWWTEHQRLRYSRMQFPSRIVLEYYSNHLEFGLDWSLTFSIAICSCIYSPACNVSNVHRLIGL
jgi:hypothetical protein